MTFYSVRHTYMLLECSLLLLVAIVFIATGRIWPSPELSFRKNEVTLCSDFKSKRELLSAPIRA